MTVNNTEAKSAIQTAIKAFSEGNVSGNAVYLFKTLGYNTDRQSPFEEKTYAFFKDSFLDGETRFNEDKAFVREWKSVDLLFQLTQEEVSDGKSLFDTKKVDNTVIETYLFFAVELTKPDCTRTALAQITREINKVFPMPVMVVFKYGGYLTLSVINRRLHKKDEQKDVLEKVTLIKDISIANPHRAHIEILFDLSFGELYKKHKFSSFVELHNAWQKTLDTSVLNKNFYNDAAAMFTKLIGGERKIGSKKMTEKGLLQLPGNPDDTVKKEFAVRLIGRLLFCWFLKKKTSQADIPLISDKILSEKAVRQTSDYGYYHSVLEPLFFEVLNKKKHERPEYLRQNDWDQIPFLNGGLFEPHRHDFYKLNELNISVHLNTLKIPDEWCKELLGIFEHYHFTIEENTPVEIEISIDPEMLGRIFENLLAEINPETGQTARKSTGSYYTPRAIVEYMTDESLKQYLCAKTGIDERKISMLLSYQDKETDLTEKEKDKVIDALEQLKILDPACGSGAFPMGILQKMILILQKTDPDSKKWLGKLLANIPDPSAREMMRRKLEGEKDLWNYTRKLGVIRSSIYGVDIQPIAAEISKLRFFLSLVVDEKISDNDPQGNRGILPLPNLEFKFVCANTLIGLPKGDVGLFESQDAIEKLKKLHTAYFSSYDEEKQGIRNEFDEVQKQMTKRLLEWKEIKDSEMLRLAAWNPFSGDSCGWFDPEWMFGVKDGFDIVIGNPPYIVTKDKVLKNIYKESIFGRPNLYGFFIHCSLERLLSNGGILSFINPRTILTDAYFSALRNFIAMKYCVNSIVNIVDRRNIFEAVLQSCILNTYKKQSQTPFIKIKEIVSKEDLMIKQYEHIQKEDFFYGKDDKIFLVAGSEKHYEIFRKLIQLKPMSEYGYEFTTGKIQWDIWKDSLSNLPVKNTTRLIWAENIQRYLFGLNKNRKNIYINQSIAPVLPIPKSTIAVQRTTAVEQEYRIIATVINPEHFEYPIQCENNTSYLNKFGHYFSIESLLGILNSKLFDWFFRHINSNTHVSSGELNILPIPKIPEKAQQPFERIVDYILFLKKIEHTLPTGKDQVMSSFFEQIIDGCVYELYFEESLKKSEKDILKYLGELPAITPTASQEQTLAMIKTVFNRLYDRDHPVRQRLYYMDSVKEIRIIKGLEVHTS